MLGSTACASSCAYGGLWKNFTHFLLRLALLALGFWTFFRPSLRTTWRQSTETIGRITQFPRMLPALFALEIRTLSMSPSYLAVPCTSTQFEVVCFSAFYGIFRIPSTWTLSPGRADAGSHPSCWATRIRGQFTGTGPFDQCTGHCCTNPQTVDIHTVNESVRSNNNSISNNNTRPDKERVEGKKKKEKRQKGKRIERHDFESGCPDVGMSRHCQDDNYYAFIRSDHVDLFIDSL